MNIISSDFPEEKADSAFRYQRSREVVEILKQPDAGPINYAGEVYDFHGLTTDPVAPTRSAGRSCISAAILPMRWSCAASIATST